MTNYYSILVTLVFEPCINKFYPQLLKVAVRFQSNKLPPDFYSYPLEYKEEIYKLLPDHLLEHSRIGDIEFIHDSIII